LYPSQKTKNNMKKILTGALALLLFTAVQAQTETTRDEHRGGRKPMAELNLSADQKTKLKAIHQREKAEMDAVKANTAITQEQRRTQHMAIRDKYREEMKTILTPEQRLKAEQVRSEMKGKHGEGRPGEPRDTIRGRGRGPADARGKDRGARMEKIQKELNLTADQQQKVRQIRQDFKGRIDAVRNDASLSQEQKKEKMKEIMKAQGEQMKTVLTPEQQQKMKELRKGGRKGAGAVR
jgi:Spy/CpxP family protein refolding chaperone